MHAWATEPDSKTSRHQKNNVLLPRHIRSFWNWDLNLPLILQVDSRVPIETINVHTAPTYCQGPNLPPQLFPPNSIHGQHDWMSLGNWLVAVTMGNSNGHWKHGLREMAFGETWPTGAMAGVTWS